MTVKQRQEFFYSLFKYTDRQGILIEQVLRLAEMLFTHLALLLFCLPKIKVTKQKGTTVKGATAHARKAHPAVKCRDSF